ncbi:unnamed protein product [Durusdinium trenchii]|uniref:Uncharacterized protein n=1 Tax=Durusdinium trenchii TaxID=1381693 RepID=A0ABP0I420_9DINO
MKALPLKDLSVEAAVGVPLPERSTLNLPGPRIHGRFRQRGLKDLQDFCKSFEAASDSVSCSLRDGGVAEICGPRQWACIELLPGPTTSFSTSVELWNHRVFWAQETKDFPRIDVEDTPGLEKVLVLYCGPLDLKFHPRYAAKIIHEPVDRCAEALRRSAQRLPDLWIFFVSPFTWDARETKICFEALQKAMTRPWLLAAGLPIQGRDGLWQWPARQLRYRFYKLQYRRASFETGDPEDNCWAGEASSGTRLYRPGALPALLQKTITTDVATMMVELDLLAKLGKIPPRWSTRPKRRHRHRQRESASVPRGQILTCAVGAVSREEDYAQSAQLPDAFAQQFHLEAVSYVSRQTRLAEHGLGGEDVANGSAWSHAHILAEERLATSLLYRRRIEETFVKIVDWWRSLDPKRHFAAPKQGTLLTAMIRGGDVSMMPWDTDLEMSLYSTGTNPVLRWCDDILNLQERRKCVLRKLEEELQLPMIRGPDLFFSQWLYEAHLTFAKFRVTMDHVFDVNFESYVPVFPIRVSMFGTELRTSWPVWEHLFFEVFQGSLEKKVGTSGNIALAVTHCTALEHNACIPPAEPPLDFDFEDYFAHSRDLTGGLFPD